MHCRRMPLQARRERGVSWFSSHEDIAAVLKSPEAALFVEFVERVQQFAAIARACCRHEVKERCRALGERLLDRLPLSLGQLRRLRDGVFEAVTLSERLGAVAPGLCSGSAPCERGI